MTSSEPVLRLRTGRTTSRRIDDEVVVLDLGTSKYLTLNATGGTLWSMLEDGATRSQLAERLVADHGVDRDRALADVDAFVVSCRGQDVLEEDGPGA